MNPFPAASGLRQLVLAAAFSAAAIVAATVGESPEGEYEGGGYGAQVVALPDGKFHIVGWRHGLPGVAPDAERIADGDGASAGGGAARFKGNIWKAEIEPGGELTGSDDQGHEWTLHRVVRESPTLGAKPPPGAVILFDGRDLAAWAGGRIDERRLLAGSAESKQRFESFALHLEFLAPPRSSAGSLVLGGHYEIAIRDSFGSQPDAESCGAILHHDAPAVCAAFPPGQWQTLDLDFVCAGFDTQDRKTKNATVTVKQNGIAVQERRELPVPADPTIPETPGPEPIQWRDAKGEIRLRNVWLVEKE